MGLSEKQLAIMKFPYSGYDAIIADGAVRAGKTSIMSLSFVLWAMGNFNNCYFAICGKSVGAVTRNILNPLLTIQYLKNQFDISYNRSDHCLTVRRGQKQNRFYFFGGKDESSYTLIQGMTLAGVLLDEVALMPRSFVEQALARCSVEGSKFWFNCNPENPRHWFRMEWLLQLDNHNALHLHFTMDDNPSLSEAMKQRYKTQYSGVFYKRYIEGLWVMAEGVVYDMFDSQENVYRPSERPVDLHWTGDRTIAIDYGTTNPMRFLDVYDYKGKLYVDREYSWDSRLEYAQKTDSEYADDLAVFISQVQGEAVKLVFDAIGEGRQAAFLGMEFFRTVKPEGELFFRLGFIHAPQPGNVPVFRKCGQGRTTHPMGGGIRQRDARFFFHLQKPVIQFVPFGVGNQGIIQHIIGVRRFVQIIHQFLHGQEFRH